MAVAQGLGMEAYARGLSAKPSLADDRFSSWRVGSKVGSASLTSISLHRQRRKASIRVSAAPFEFGARDPFPEEIASNFGDKVLGYGDTEHIVLVPTAPVLSLAQRSCVSPLPPGTTPFSLIQAKALLRKIVGWRLVEEQSGLKLQCEWRLKDHAAGLELSRRLLSVSEPEGKLLKLHFDEHTHVLRAELWTESLGGLCENDYIVAAKIDQVKTTDLIKKMRAWA